MPLDSGMRLGAYEIVSPLGAGGMGEVYKARDTRLDRIVAIKVLPDALAVDPEFRERFDREARVISSLSHPHICPLFDVGRQDGIEFLVMEFLDGVTLADEVARFKDQGLPIEDVLRLGIEIGSALDAAHRAGIVHRDLKPGNVLITKTGAKLLDFGLAKGGHTGWASAVAAAGASGASRGTNLTAPPTMTTPPNITARGTILGTFQYMAPEQLEGAEADPRTDIFAFGCVLYEMLTGRKAFHGKTQVSLIGAILKDTPLPVNTHRAAAPPALAWVVGRCLAKDPDRRWQTASDLVSQLEWIAEGGGEVPRVEAKAPPKSTRTQWLLAAAASVILAGLAAAGAWLLKPQPAAEQPLRFSISTIDAPRTLSTGSPFRDIAIAPDGAHIVYTVGTGTGTAQLMVRAVDQLDAVPLGGITGASPFVSPDGRWIGFFAGGGAVGGVNELHKVSMSGGPSITVCRLPGQLRGASWGSDNTIVFATAARSTGLFSVPAGGGEPKPITTLDAKRGEVNHWFPSILPGGRAALFTIVSAQSGTLDAAQVGVVDLKTREVRTLLRGGGHAEYVAPRAGSGPGYLVYAAAGALRAVRFDPVKLDVLSDPVPIVEQVMTKQSGAAEFSVSSTGTLVYVQGTLTSALAPQRALVLVDRQGREEPIAAAPPRAYSMPRLSPDDSRIALDIRDQENDIWIWDRARQTLTRLTFDAANDNNPAWTPDGRRILFASNREGHEKVFWQAADGTGTAERLTNAENAEAPYSISPDGKLVILRQSAGSGFAGLGTGLGLLSLDAKPRTEPLLRSNAVQVNGDISPDGHWLAYQSTESGQQQIYVRPFPKVDNGRWQISTTGGTHPLWARTGRELFYLDATGRLTTVPVKTTPTFSAGNPTRLFETRYFTGVGRPYDATRDGKQFLMIKAAASAEPASTGTPSPPIIVVHNWTEELRQRLPAR